MVSVRPVTAADFEQVYPLLDWHDSALGKTAWQRIFDYAWHHEEPHCGYGLFDADEAVGFLGFIFSDRTISGQKAKFCNLTTWVVKPQYRGHSLSLMMPVMRLKDYTITDLSAGSNVIKISQRLGFKDLDTAVQVLLPYQGMSSTAAGHMLEGNAITTLSLKANDLRVFQDHQPYANCHQLVIQDGTSYCHVIYTQNRDPELSYCHIQSISDHKLFERHHWAIRQQMMRCSGIPLIVIDARLLASVNLPLSYRLPLSSPRIYRSSQLQPSQIDNLYSELTLLAFPTSDCLALGWREKAMVRCLPFIKRLFRCR